MPAISECRQAATDSVNAVTLIPWNSLGYATRFFRARSNNEQAPATFPVE